MGLMRRRGMLKEEKPALPAGYTAYDYVQNNSANDQNAPILTGLGAGYNDVSRYAHELTFAATTIASKLSSIYGLRNGTGQTSIQRGARGAWITANNDRMQLSYNGETIYTTTPLVLGRKYTLETRSGGVYWDGELQASASTGATINIPSGSISLFGFCTSNAFSSGYITNIIKIYRFRIYDMTEQRYICDMVPCKNPSNASGMYDLVREAFYTSRTAGRLSCGND